MEDLWNRIEWYEQQCSDDTTSGCRNKNNSATTTHVNDTFTRNLGTTQTTTSAAILEMNASGDHEVKDVTKDPSKPRSKKKKKEKKQKKKSKKTAVKSPNRTEEQMDIHWKPPS